MKLRFAINLGQYIIVCAQYFNTLALVGVNVTDTVESRFSFVACITNRVDIDIILDRDLICTGTLITRSDILSAEHCLINKTLNSFQVVVGSLILIQAKIHYPLKVITFQQWAEQKQKPIEFEENDIAIIKLTQEVSRQIKPASISYKSDNKLYGADVTMAGWGMSKTFPFSSNLKVVEVKVLTKDVCEAKISSLNQQNLFLEPRLLCTFRFPFALLQFGDSGGPLLYKRKVVAINKGTAPLPEVNIHPQKVNIHFNLKFYEKFISDVTK